MAGKVVKINGDLYKEIVKLIGKSDYKYKYNSISAFVNEAVYETLAELKSSAGPRKTRGFSRELKEDKHHIKFFKIRL